MNKLTPVLTITILGFMATSASGAGEKAGGKPIQVQGNKEVPFYSGEWKLDCKPDKNGVLNCIVETPPGIVGPSPNGAKVDMIVVEGGEGMICPTWVFKNGQWVRIC